MPTPVQNSDLPAILGGQPVRPDGPPDWPPANPDVAEVLAQLARDRSWGRYHGPHCDALIARLAEVHRCGHVILCSSGTAAVELALRGARVGTGDEVILSAYDFKGNFQDILTVGATPVLVDVARGTVVPRLELLAEAITPKTRAILVSHLHGNVVPMAALMDLARSHGVSVIEDACQMPGAIVEGKIAGGWGDVGVLSFGGSKLLTAGRGGAVITSDAEIAQRIRLHVQRGNDAYPLSEMQAAVLLPQVNRLAADNGRRAAAAVRVISELEVASPVLKPLRNFTGNSFPGYYKVGFSWNRDGGSPLSREVFAKAVRAEGIALDPGFRSLHRIHSARRYRAVSDLMESDVIDETILTLHHPVLLQSDEVLDQILEAVARVERYQAEIAVNVRC